MLKPWTGENRVQILQPMKTKSPAKKGRFQRLPCAKTDARDGHVAAARDALARAARARGPHPRLHRPPIARRARPRPRGGRRRGRDHGRDRIRKEHARGIRVVQVGGRARRAMDADARGQVRGDAGREGVLGRRRARDVGAPDTALVQDDERAGASARRVASRRVGRARPVDRRTRANRANGLLLFRCQRRRPSLPPSLVRAR